MLSSNITLKCLLVAVGFGITACNGPLSTLDPAGPAAGPVSWLWWGMLAFFTLVLVSVTALWVHAIRRQPAVGNVDRQEKAWIIGGGIILPSVSILVLLVVSVPVGNLMSALPAADDDALQIRITAHQWRWQVEYPDSDTEDIAVTTQNIVHIPAGVPVHLTLSSADVIHSFWVPRLAGKLDMIPGRVNELQIQADEPGVYRGVCAEFCGLAHASMRFEVHAHSREDFAQWLAEASGD